MHPILLLCTRKRKPVFGADAQRIYRPSYTAVVRTNSYLRRKKNEANLKEELETYRNLNILRHLLRSFIHFSWFHVGRSFAFAVLLFLC